MCWPWGLRMNIKDHLRKFNCYQTVARFWWDMADDIKTWRFLILSSIPGKFGIYIRTRLLVKHFGSCGKSPFIMRYIKVDNPGRLFIGDYFRCHIDLYISAGGIVEIGNYVGIGPSVKIWSINHKFDRLDIPIYEQSWEKKKIIIEDDVWIGANSIILPGSHIGKGSVISAGCILGKSVRPYSIVAGNPGRIIGYRVSKEEYFKNG